ncbi:unnamed protein product [Nesidiocoris tenuis]|uniref:Uncharacterized protein n=1 Tax=Nesidiocoris tenuis TaxID=355587 RepID=A0A6H5GVV8_9HEMI|nr:unnamed protein product [Nesidiocoris tenuis]
MKLMMPSKLSGLSQLINAAQHQPKIHRRRWSQLQIRRRHHPMPRYEGARWSKQPTTPAFNFGVAYPGFKLQPIDTCDPVVEASNPTTSFHFEVPFQRSNVS